MKRMMRNAALRRYCRAVGRWLPCSRREKKRILAGLRADVSAFLERTPGAGTAQIEAQFGQPQVIAAACVENLDAKELLRILLVRRRVAAAVMAAIAAALILWGAGIVWELVELNNVLGGYGVTTVVDFGPVK